MAGINLYVILKVVGILIGGIAGFVGTVTETKRETGFGRKGLTLGGWICAICIIVGASLAGTSQILDSRKQYSDNEAKKHTEDQKDADFKAQFNRLLAAQNLDIRKQAQANVASKIRLIEPDTGTWLSDSNTIAKKRMEFAANEAERVAKEAEMQSRKSNQVYEDLLFSVEFTKTRAHEIQDATGEEMEIPTNGLPDNLCSTPFQSLIEFKKSKAIWNVYTRTDALDANDGYPWLSIEFSDYHGDRTGGVNLQAKPLEDSFRISYEENRKVLIDKRGKLADFQTTARRVIEQALQVQYLLTAPPLASVK